MRAARIEQVSLAKLRENARNTRTHPKRQIRRLADNIQRFGFTSPIVADDNYVILAGHARFKAATLGAHQLRRAVKIAGRADRGYRRDLSLLNSDQLHGAGIRTAGDVAMDKDVSYQCGESLGALVVNIRQPQRSGRQETVEYFVRFQTRRQLRFIWRLVIELLDDIKSIRFHSVKQPHESALLMK
jgi:hypothetical protein